MPMNHKTLTIFFMCPPMWLKLQSLDFYVSSGRTVQVHAFHAQNDSRIILYYIFLINVLMGTSPLD
jgi:hypothetical protein